MRTSSAASRWAKLAPLVAAASALAACAAVVYVAAAPIHTADFWWHLALGELYASGGPWPGADPFTHTAERPPEPHAWLFDLALFGAWRAVGFQGLRALHALAVLGILALAWSCFRRVGGSATAASAAAVAFAVLSWYQLVQLRPGLASIAATLALYRLLVEPGGPPSWRRVAAAAGLFALWANAHGLFAAGLALVGAAACGAALAEILARRLPGGAGVARGRAARLLAALGLGAAASLANPLGAGAHRAFAAAEVDLWRVGDEWAPFPFAWTHDPGGMSWLAWIATQALFAATALAGLAAAARFARRRDVASLGRADPALLALSGASAVAVLVGSRFLWHGFFPLLYLLGALAPVRARRPRLADAALAAAALALALAFPRLGGIEARARQLPAGAREYLARPWLGTGNDVHAVRFLREAGLEGNLFNSYASGGFLDFWLAPRLRTFIDGRLNVPNAVLLDYFRIASMSDPPAGGSWLGLLDAHRVDLFLGAGAPTLVPPERPRTYTAGHLEGHPDWVLVSRSIDHALYLRRGERNRENLERTAAWYAREGLPFDPERGLDPDALIRERPEWAMRHGLLPLGHPALVAASDGPDARLRRRALERLGLGLLLAGAWESQVAIDLRAARLGPRDPAPRLRLAFAWLRLGRAGEALAASRELLALQPGEPRALQVAAAAGELLRRGAADPAVRARRTQPLPIVHPTEIARLRRHFADPLLEPAARHGKVDDSHSSRHREASLP